MYGSHKLQSVPLRFEVSGVVFQEMNSNVYVPEYGQISMYKAPDEDGERRVSKLKR